MWTWIAFVVSLSLPECGECSDSQRGRLASQQITKYPNLVPECWVTRHLWLDPTLILHLRWWNQPEDLLPKWHFLAGNPRGLALDPQSRVWKGNKTWVISETFTDLPAASIFCCIFSTRNYVNLEGDFPLLLSYTYIYCLWKLWQIKSMWSRQCLLLGKCRWRLGRRTWKRRQLLNHRQAGPFLNQH